MCKQSAFFVWNFRSLLRCRRRWRILEYNFRVTSFCSSKLHEISWREGKLQEQSWKQLQINFKNNKIQSTRTQKYMFLIFLLKSAKWDGDTEIAYLHLWKWHNSLFQMENLPIHRARRTPRTRKSMAMLRYKNSNYILCNCCFWMLLIIRSKMMVHGGATLQQLRPLGPVLWCKRLCLHILNWALYLDSRKWARSAGGDHWDFIFMARECKLVVALLQYITRRA